MPGPTIKSEIDLHTSENRQRLSKMTFRLFKNWELNAKDQAALLGLSVENQNTLSRYSNGAPFADQQDLMSRAGHLLGIHKSLQLIFPHNKDLACRWISQPNRNFNGATPLDVMKTGYVGILTVCRYLDFERG